jgi:hypothetical protein
MIQQSPILKHPLIETSLGREVSAAPSPRISSFSSSSGVNAYTSRSGGNEALVEERGIAVASQMERRVLVKMRERGRDFMVRCFERDRVTGQLFVGWCFYFPPPQSSFHFTLWDVGHPACVSDG